MSKESKKNSPKLLLDEHIWAYLATLLREQGFDVVHVNEVNLDATPDEKILRFATGEHKRL
jgi:predicted nuclease of predicted toxin-antitoxin system